MLENYLEEQYVPTTLLQKALNNNKLVQAYLFYHDDINYLMKYAKAFAKEIICFTSKNEKILKSIENETYSELKIVVPDGNFIKKEQLIELQNSVMNKPVLGDKIVYIIKNCDKLNSSSANSILKFLEEPADNIIAILLTDNISNVMSTILSRCQVINLNKVTIDKNYTTNELLNLAINIYDIEENEFYNLINNSIDFINDIETKKINTLIQVKKKLWEKCTDSNRVLSFLNILIYFYMDVLYLKSENEIRYFFDELNQLNKISDLNDTDKIIRKIYILELIKDEVYYNVNTKLIFDKLIIELGDV